MKHPRHATWHKRAIAAVTGVGLLTLGLAVPALVTAPVAVGANGVPAYNKIVILVEENKTDTQIIGSSQAPYFNQLAAGGANMTQMFAEAHPSQPNYLALYSGSTQGQTGDTYPHTFNSDHLAAQLYAAGKTFKGYSEHQTSGANQLPYHSPWKNTWTPTAVGSNDKPDFTAFPQGNFSALPDVSFVIPDACNDMHNCSVSTGDTWARNNIDAYAQWAKANNSLLIATWDENDSSVSSNKIATILYGANIVPGSYNQTINHYNLLGMIEDAKNLPRMNGSVGKAAITGPFTTQTPPPPPPPSNDGTTAASVMNWGAVTAGDEFNYTGAPDSTKWSAYSGPGHAGNGTRNPNKLWVDVDHLSIAGDANGNTGGMEALFAKQKYGRWEARIRTNSTEPKYHAVSILWPDTASAKCAEIDYAEQNESVANMNFYYHYNCSGPTNSATVASDNSSWHNYAVDWSPAGVVGYRDGVEWFRDSDTSRLPEGSMHQTFQLDWFPVSGQATQASWMDVDWVRVYAAGAGAPPAANEGTTAAKTLGWGAVVAGDEFNYVGAPDSTKWSAYSGAGPNGSVRDPAQLWVDVDHLSIAGKSDGTTGGLSAKFAQQQYGRWEARIRNSATDSQYRPTALLYPQGASAKCSSLDYGKQGTDTGQVRIELKYTCTNTKTSASKVTDAKLWHNVAVDWSPAGIVGYYDGAEWFRDMDPTHQPDQIMKQAFQLDWSPVAGQPTIASWFDIDWVRVYAAGTGPVGG